MTRCAPGLETDECRALMARSGLLSRPQRLRPNAPYAHRVALRRPKNLCKRPEQQSSRVASETSCYSRVCASSVVAAGVRPDSESEFMAKPVFRGGPFGYGRGVA